MKKARMTKAWTSACTERNPLCFGHSYNTTPEGNPSGVVFFQFGKLSKSSLSIQDLGSDPIQLSDQHIRLYPEQIFQHLILIEPLSVAGPGLIDHFVKHRPQFLQAPLRIRRAYINFLKTHSFLYISLLNRTLWLPCQSTGPAHRAHTRPCP